jgi:Arc/MetJ-type ribon-helix-helix transcriptional regulator
MTQYATVKLPQEVVTEINKLVGKYGFSSRAEVVKDALRDFFRKYPETCGQALGKLSNAEQEA